MSNDYILQEFNKIIQDSSYEFPLNQTMACAWVMAHFKADNLKIFDLRNASTLVDFAVVSTSQNVTQTRAIADQISSLIKKQDVKLVSYEGHETADWILIDTGDIMIHLFNGPAREIYDLDAVYKLRPQIQIPENFYFSQAPERTQEKEDLKNYF